MVPSINKILFATDLSEISRYAFEYAVSLADKQDAELLIVHIIKGASPFGTELVKMAVGDDVYKQLEQKHAQYAREILIGKRSEALVLRETIQHLRSEAEMKVSPTKSLKINDRVIEASSVSEEILRLVETEGCDLVILGHRKRHLLASGLGEGTLKKVLKKTTVPVLVVPPLQQ